MKLFRARSFLFLCLALVLPSCRSQQQSSPSEHPNKLGTVTTELAPFDRFPPTDPFPLVFRFSDPVAPADRSARENFSALSIEPNKHGAWRWGSDSELRFEPLNAFRPGESLVVSLAGLRTSSGTLGVSPSFSPDKFHIALPAPDASLTRCEFEIKNRAPLIQYPVITIRFNYEAMLNNALNFAHLSFKQGRKSETLVLSAPSWSAAGMELSLQGPDLFRPETATAIDFSFQPGLLFKQGGALEKPLHCTLQADPTTWDKLAEELKNAPVERPLVVLSTTPLTRHGGDPKNDARTPLRLQFRDAATSESVNHGKAKGLTLDQGLRFEPSLIGTWKTDEDDGSVFLFTPAVDWPVGQLFRITVDPNNFPDVELKDREVTLATPQFEGRFTDSRLYTDPVNPTLRQVVATLEFSHLPKQGEVERLLSIRMRVEPEKNFFGTGARSLSFTAKADEKEPWRIYARSENISLADDPGQVQLLLGQGAISAEGGTPSTSTPVTLVTVPSKRDIFRIESASAAVAKRKDDRLERILTFEVSEPTTAEALQGALELFLLPDCSLKENKKLCRDNDQLGDEALVFPEVLAKAEALPRSPIPHDEATHPNTFHFSFEAPGKREVFVRVRKDLRSSTGFSLAADYRTVLYTSAFPRELQIMHQGALLSVSSSRKLGVSVRGVPKVEFELARVLARDVHHLISVTSGSFADPNFYSSEINLDQLAERVRYVESFPNQDPSRTSYTAVDFTRFMSHDAPPRGLFVLTVREKADKKKLNESPATSCGEEGEECETEEASSECEGGEGEECLSSVPDEQRRLVLLTDLGLLVKDSLAGEHTVFVMSFRTGKPVSGAAVKLLGQNGVPLFTATTNEDGRVDFPRTADFEREKAPLVYTVEKGDDYSFLPFGRRDRELNFSRFETGGVVNREEAEGLRALVFSDRGIYRPGEEARFGIIVRRRNLQLAGDNLPLELSLTDPRGVEILKRKFVLSHLGLDDFRWSSENSLAGTYSLGIYLVRARAGEKRSLLGSTSFRVDEFQPDKLSVKTRYVDSGVAAQVGWSSKHGAFETNVSNLFGTVAVDNSVKGTLLVRPWEGTFAQYPEFTFYTRDTETKLPERPEDLGELHTDSSGMARFTPDLERFAERAFRLEFAAEAFEKDSGRSVVSTAAVLVSQAPHFLGWKADGDLQFINKGAGRKVSLVSVDTNLKPVALSGIETKLEQTEMISALIKQPNGTLRYEMTPKVTLVSTTPFSTTDKGSELILKTDQPGDFKLRFFEQSGTELASIHYLVHGEGNTAFLADRTAEVGIQLKKSAVEKDEELEISINTPYVGSGLITIEREKIYATKWFHTDTLSSVQRIKVPAGVVGNAYVSVAFVRSLDSKDIFSAPLSYGAKPFSIARSEYTTEVTLTAPEKAKPGADLPVNYHLSAPGKFLLFAVDEGILQFARYKNPDPVQSFVPKRALEVETYQILDLLLPDHKIVEELSSPGGDEDIGLGKFKNPFARKRRAPMAFWSGVLPENSVEGTIAVPVPEYFNGTIRLVAVQVGESKLGVQTSKVVAQHDFVIDPQIPYFVSPGDEFEVGATVANTLANSGKNVQLQLNIAPAAAFDILGEKTFHLTVPEGEDRSFTVKLRAKEVLGEQAVRIEASGVGHTDSASDTISIRPPQAFRTTIQAGIYRPDKDGHTATKKLSFARTLYPEKREVAASISSSPISVGRALIAYLKEYPYGCTEQLVSVAFPAALFGADPDLSLSPEDVSRFTRRAFEALSSRQRADGSFGLWDATSEPDILFSVYATHFLLEAREHSLEIPDKVFTRATAWLTRLSQQPSYEAPLQLAQAYALYVRARLGEQVTKDAQRLVADLDRQWQANWRQSAISIFLAGTFRLLQLDTEATALLKHPPQIWNSQFAWPLSDPALYGSVYSWISTKHFPKDTWLSPLDTVIPLAQMIEERSFSSFNSAFAILGLEALGGNVAGEQREYLKILGESAPNSETPLDLFGTRILRATVPLDTRSLSYHGKNDQVFFYEASETGFDRTQVEPFESGLTVDRELRNEKGDKTDEFGLDNKAEVKLFIKATTPLERVAVLELIPGGFEIDLSDEGLASRRSLHEDSNTWHPTFIDIQEDRVIFFGDLSGDTQTFSYRLKPLRRGNYTFAAPYAEGMYDQTKRFQGRVSTVRVK